MSDRGAAYGCGGQGWAGLVRGRLFGAGRWVRCLVFPGCCTETP